ncbi:hypothetical protein FE257_007659 [Aspergillus nanangensis]|uniref:C2H2-type domain-containing protein n=1 Tax=Aspergillus nanangensis TaxID=2582783 RepID=A0AAD4CMD4_ASPNN|nr:hypothetical protein FE257_007659 [Aspergillus nanangensis]
MSSFLPVNNISSPPDRVMEEATTPTTPRPTTRNMTDAPDAKRTDVVKDEGTPRNVHNHSDISQSGTMATSDDFAHGDSDGDRDGSDHEADKGSNAPPSKKKKGQRFYCTDYPPCNLSFTRSEHLARHIRKHTGERPFQCHCSRRFSRLDNLRQHAQTVHVNEEIPGDSLAATGTRFQRQIRTDRVRPQGRARAGTGGSQGTHSRGHSRNLSTSSITSTASTFSQAPDLRRRPPPLIMASDGRPRLAMDAMADGPSTPPAQVREAPISHLRCPQHLMLRVFGMEKQLLAACLSRLEQTHLRRNLLICIHPDILLRRIPHPEASSPVQSALITPCLGMKTPMVRQTQICAEEHGIPRRIRLLLVPRQAGSSEQPPRLPGIESFDKVVSQRPLTPPVRRPSPMQVDHPNKPPPSYGFGGGFNYSQPSVRPPPPVSGAGHRRGHVSWDMSLHTNLTGLHIRDKPPLKDASNWGQQTIAEIQSVGSHPSTYQPYDYRRPSGHAPSFSNASSSQATRTSPEDSSSSEGVHTPSTASVEYHPTIVHNSGFIEPHNTPFSSDTSQAAPQSDGYQSKHDPRPDMFSHHSGRESGMVRLEALVAVATSENKSATKLFA